MTLTTFLALWAAQSVVTGPLMGFAFGKLAARRNALERQVEIALKERTA